MRSFIYSIFMVMKDVVKEISANSSKYIFVTSEKDMQDKLKKLKVDSSKVEFYDSGLPVKDWTKVAGVFKVKNDIYAYSRDIQSELGASIRSI